MTNEVKNTETKKIPAQELNRLHTHEKITSDKCEIIYHDTNSRMGSDGGHNEIYLSVSDVSSEKAYVTFRKILDDRKRDELEIILALDDSDYNERASRAVGVA